MFRIPALGRRLITRFLGKIGLGVVAARLGRAAFGERYDALRRHTRVGDRPAEWGAARGVLPEDQIFHALPDSQDEEVTVYDYALGFCAGGSDVVFALQYVEDVYVLYLTRPDADEALLHCLRDAPLVAL